MIGNGTDETYCNCSYRNLGNGDSFQGPSGYVWTIGPTGPTGPMGPEGLMGPIGPMGPAGSMGTDGSKGVDGFTGHTGHTGHRGHTGHTGHTGHMGHTGPAGQVGPTGPTHSTTDTFIHVYSITEQQLSQNQSVVFDTNNAIFGNCAHQPNSPNIWIWRPGYYHVYTSIYHLEASQFSLVKNKTQIVSGSTVGSLSGSSQNTTVFIMHLTDKDMIMHTTPEFTGRACNIQLVNYTHFLPFITLYGSKSSGNPIPQITATITIMLLK
jgi:hypothetical protein